MTSKELLVSFNKDIINKNLSHAILINTNNISEFDNFSKEFIRMFFCINNSLTDDNCIWCEKSKKNILIDKIIIGDFNSNIKKEEIQDVIYNFSKTSIEDRNLKIYLILGANLMTKEAANSLLKFLEEPPLNTFAFLVTNNLSDVIPTIKSRSKIYNLFEDVKFLDQNPLFKLISLNNKNEILLFDLELKNKSSEEILEYATDLLQQKNKISNPLLIEALLDFKNDIQSKIIITLAIQKFLIRVCEK